jgi:hypothetical protein
VCACNGRNLFSEWKCCQHGLPQDAYDEDKALEESDKKKAAPVEAEPAASVKARPNAKAPKPAKAAIEPKPKHHKPPSQRAAPVTAYAWAMADTAGQG